MADKIRVVFITGDISSRDEYCVRRFVTSNAFGCIMSWIMLMGFIYIIGTNNGWGIHGPEIHSELHHQARLVRDGLSRYSASSNLPMTM